jgi:tRNA pseudouridine32 synthase/23S rRNA pseudouridine746 synthase
MYPVLRDEVADFNEPMQLLARELSFIDPFTEDERRFLSLRSLDL